MKILGIETSCDETGASIIEASAKLPFVKIRANVLASSLALHSKTGGIIPEIAAREQLKYIIPTIDSAFKEACIKSSEIDAIAVTIGPGLIGSLLVGVETAKTFAYALNKPIIPVNHLFGHIYANWIDDGIKKDISFPVIALIVSGGHTDIVLMKSHEDILWIGGTRDDAAGEAFDKIGRLIGLSYPAGPEIEKIAKNGDPKSFTFPRPMIKSLDFDFSFSGLKSAVLREVQKVPTISSTFIANISASAQEAIIDILTIKTLKAAINHGAKSILIAGGVAANKTLKKRFEFEIKKEKLETTLYVPSPNLCTDNAAMIATAGFFQYKASSWKDITANPQLYFD